MKAYDESVLEGVKQELEFIWRVQELAKLNGEMRLFTPRSKDYWQSHEAGFEVWFSQDNIDDAINKIKLFYRNGEQPNSPFFLDPIVYKRSPSQPQPIPQGTAFLGISAYIGTKVEISEDVEKRLKQLNVHFDYLHGAEEDGTTSEKSGIKAVCMLREPVMPAHSDHRSDGNLAVGVQELIDIMDLNADIQIGHYYPLSGIVYNHQEAHYQHESFLEMFPEKRPYDARDIEGAQIFVEKIQDAGKCWNAYGRRQLIYDRYGIDVMHLEENLEKMRKSDERVGSILNELNTIWAAHKRHGLNGEMRLFTAPHQDTLRSKHPGIELWFDDQQDHMMILAEEVQRYYNAGILPNSPILLDPIVYQKQEDGTRKPIGSGVAWASLFSVGLEKYDPETSKRIDDMNCFTGSFIRAGTMDSGLKVVAFLDKPVMFDESIQLEKEGTPPIVSGCKELFDIGNVNGVEYWPYYMVTGLEYLCTNGAYANDTMSDEFPEDATAQQALVEKFTVKLQTILDGATCWEKYDRLDPLWKRFGIDIENLDRNLKYYNLCGRNFEFLNMTGDSRDSVDEKFEFVVPGWVPRAAITIIGATGGTGKSSVAHRLGVLTSSDWEEDEPGPKWLGSEIDKKDCEGVTIYLSGEDAAPIVNARADMFDPEGRSKRLLLKCGAEFGHTEDGKPKDISHFLEELSILPKVDMVVIDPARKYLVGDEDDSEVVSQFFEAIEKFSIEKNCGMVIVHHLQKKAHPERVTDIVDLLRGSQVFIDRARVVIGMLREGPHTIAGLAKNNIPPQLGMVEGERLFVRDPDRLDLIQLPGEEGIRSYEVSRDELREIKAQMEKDQEENSEGSSESAEG